MKVFVIVSFLLTLAPTALRGLDVITQKSANIGEEVELYCRHSEATSNVNEIVWIKNGEIWFELGFKEDQRCYVAIGKTFAKLVIPSVEENDAGLYQCKAGDRLTNLTVLQKTSQNASTESSVYKHVELLHTIINSGYVNILLNCLITFLIGIGIIIAFYMHKWWKGKFKQCQPNAELQECETPLINDFHQSVEVMRQQQQTLTHIVMKLKDMGSMYEALAEELSSMKESNAQQCEDLVIAEIGKLDSKITSFHSILVNEMKQLIKRQDEAIKNKGLQEMTQQSWSSVKPGISVTDAEL